MSRFCGANLRRARSDGGMSLVELIVAMAVSALFLGLIATVFAQGLSTQQQQAVRNQASVELNAFSVHLTESLRNADTARASTDRTRLDIRVLADDGATFECRSWVIAENKLWFSSGPGARGAWNSEWAVLASNLIEAEDTGFTQGARSSVHAALTAGEGDNAFTIHDGGYPRVVTSLEGERC